MDGFQSIAMATSRQYQSVPIERKVFSRMDIWQCRAVFIDLVNTTTLQTLDFFCTCAGIFCRHCLGSRDAKSYAMGCTACCPVIYGSAKGVGIFYK